MKLRFLEWQDAIYIRIGIGYDTRYSPPDVFYAIPLDFPYTNYIITERDLTIIPMAEAIEIVDEIKLKVLSLLFE